MRMTEIPPPGYHEHVWLSATGFVQDCGDSQLAELASAKRI